VVDDDGQVAMAFSGVASVIYGLWQGLQVAHR